MTPCPLKALETRAFNYPFFSRKDAVIFDTVILRHAIDIVGGS